MFKDVAEYSQGQPSTTPLRKYAFGSYIDEPVALIDHTGAASGTGTGANNGTTTVYHYHANHLYSIAALTDQSGQVVERYAYDAYGQQVILDAAGTTVRAASLIQNRFTYTGREWDAESHTYHYRARTYDARLARFLQRDPIGFRGGLNLTVYVGGRSLGAVDPFGHEAFDMLGGTGMDWSTPTDDPFIEGVRGFLGSIGGSVASVCTGDTGRAMGDRAYQIASQQAGHDLTEGEIDDWTGPKGYYLGWVMIAELGPTPLVEGLGGFDAPTYEPLSLTDSIARGAGGLSGTIGFVAPNLPANVGSYRFPLPKGGKLKLPSCPCPPETPPAKVAPKTTCGDGAPSPKDIKNARQRGVNRAKSAERDLVESGHPGTADDGGWSWAERKRIAETGQFPDDIEWHHINDVHNNPGLADVPDNVTPSRGGRPGHVQKYHPNGTRQGSAGSLLDRSGAKCKHLSGGE